ncbi:MAG TPA: VWA domain-containing protein [Oligoflexia bacterium]|nr:VWA domain-containing protein [Oligoflexia bacterium]HMP49032.1 VWA domain-containing protein [Oligoflexia bacterium]
MKNIINTITGLDFAHLELLLLVIPVLLLVFWWSRLLKRDQQLKNFVLPASVIKSYSTSGFIPELSRYRLNSISIFSLAMFFLILSLTQPRLGFETIETRHEGADIVIAVDVSESMLAEDTLPDRLTIAKRKVEDLTQIISGDRLSLLSFAGASFIETPLTLDYGILSLTSENLSTDLVPLKGSDLEAAVHAAITVFGENNKSPERSRILLIFSDMEFDPETIDVSFSLMNEHNILPFGIAIGTAEGAPLVGPRGFRKDSSGKVIYTRSEIEKLVSKFSDSGGFLTRYSSSDNDLKTVYKNIKSSSNNNSLVHGESRIWNEYYQIPLFIGLLLIFFLYFKPFLGQICINKKSSPLSYILSRKQSASSIMLALFLLLTLCKTELEAQSRKELDNLNKLYTSGKYSEALEAIQNLEHSGYESHELMQKKGNILYRLNRFDEAAQAFDLSYKNSNTSSERSRALFNKGNALTQGGLLKDALVHYEEAQKETPEDSEIDQNISYIKKLLKEENQDKDKKKDNNKENQNKEVSSSDKESSDSNKNNENNENNNNQKDSQSRPENDQNKNNKPEINNESDNSSDQNQDNDNSTDENEDTENKGNQDKDSSENSKDQNTENDNDKDSSDKQESAKERPESLPEKDSSKDHSGSVTFDQIESQLDSLEESTNLRSKYRYKKAEEQLRKFPRKKSSMDW